MKVYANFREKVDVNPKDVIEELIDIEIGYRNWIFMKNNKYYVGSEKSAGSHSFDTKEEISKEKYEYVESLKNVLKYIDLNKINNNGI